MFAFLTSQDVAILIGALTLGCAFSVAVVLFVKPRAHQTVTRAPDADPQIACVFSGTDLVDISPAGELFLANADKSDGSGWDIIRKRLASRFGPLPERPEDLFAGEPGATVIKSANRVSDSGQLVFRRVGANIRMSLIDALPTELEKQLMSETRQELSILRNTIDRAPNPVWIVSPENEITWCNRAYRELAKTLGPAGKDPSQTPLFVLNPENESGDPVRVPLQTQDGSQRRWFEVISRSYRDGWVSFANNIDAVVNAEQAQRNFVQTLTKTFAQLSIGLAIFDRKQHLALFNPALIDLTALPADFLSSRPDLLSFFDHLRDAQIMPEPKNYTSWRDKMTELVEAARDGRYSETWNLPSGLTYRVNGKPHPDGAVAFLFEDISAEISLTRRFRADLELCHAILDRQRQAVAVFSQSGILTFSNAAFRKLWDWDPDGLLTEVTLDESHDIWRDRCSEPPALSDLRDYVHGATDQGAWSQKIVHNTRGPLGLVAERLPGGATMLSFDALHSQTVSTAST